MQSLEMDGEDCRPKWLMELENRKRKPRLAHEVGAGAPCLKCDTTCPGLDLHFWRKICKNCKCGRDDHDVPNDEFPQFDLLLGPSGKSKRKFIVLKMNKQQTDNEETFEWAPPDTTKELAADYMKALPEDKLPIKGSVGAALRKQQLQKQLPLHDIDHKMCDELSDSEKKQFEKYLENLKKYVGQGKVSKIVSARPFDRSLMTPANASECLSPKHNSNAIINHPSINLRTPSSFISKSTYSPALRSLPHLSQQLTFNVNENCNSMVNDPTALPSRLENICATHVEQTANEPVKQGRFHHILENINTDSKYMAESSNIVGSSHNPATNLSNLNKSLHKSDDPVGENPNVEQNKIDNKNTGHGMIIEPCQATIIESTENKNLIQHVTKDYELATKIGRSNLPSDNSRNTENFPISSQVQRLQGIIGDKSVIEQNSTQTPLRSNTLAQQTSSELLHGVQDKYPTDYQNPMSMINKMIPDAQLSASANYNNDIIGSTLDEKELTCIREKLMAKYSAKDEGQHAINYARDSPSVPRDFKHSNVHGNNQQITSINALDVDVNLMPIQADVNRYKNPENTLIHSEKLQNPIFPNEAFSTSKIPINTLELALENLSMNSSKESKVQQQCHGCNEGIFAGDVVVTAEKANDAVWHPGCFACCTCNELLVDLVYFYYKGKLYCARDLASLMEIPRCFACDELIFVREYTVAEGHNYHVKHFCCWDCDIPLAGKQYISESDRPFCLQCYQKTYAKMCCACNKLIAADQQGVAVKNLNFHATDECFCCYNCNKSLLNGRMAIKEDKPFCSKECITTYLNKNN